MGTDACSLSPLSCPGNPRLDKADFWSRRRGPMSRRSMYVRVLVATGVTTMMLLGRAAFAQTELLPNLEPFPASSVQLVPGTSGLDLRFGTISWNRGVGPLELRGGAPDGSGGQIVNQYVRRTDGGFNIYQVGIFEFHPEHNHFHMEDYALYTLEPVDAPGASGQQGAKISFCLLDNE